MEERIENEELENKGKRKGQINRKQGQEGSGKMGGGKDRKRETGKWEGRKGQMNRKHGEKGSVRRDGERIENEQENKGERKRTAI